MSTDTTLPQVSRPVPPAGTLAAWSRTFRGTFVANFKNQLRFYTLSGWLLASLMSPIFLLASAAVIAHFLTGGGVPARFLELTGYPDYIAFVVVGLAAHGLVLSALEDGGTAVYDEEQQGTWDLVALTPVNRFVWMFAKTTAGMVASFVDFAVVLGVGIFAFGLDPAAGNVLVAVTGLVATVFALQGFGFLMAAAGLYWKQPYALAVLLSPVIVLISGLMFPVQALPPSVQVVSNAFPLTHGLHVIRDALLLNAGFADVAPAFTQLAVTGVVLMLAGFFTFRFMERRARRKGVLGRY